MHVHQTEELLEKAREVGDFRDQGRINGQLLGWAELLEKGLHQMHQQGKTKTDITKVGGKGRFDG